jgi:hypothetical protein
MVIILRLADTNTSYMPKISICQQIYKNYTIETFWKAVSFSVDFCTNHTKKLCQIPANRYLAFIIYFIIQLILLWIKSSNFALISKSDFVVFSGSITSHTPVILDYPWLSLLMPFVFTPQNTIGAPENISALFFSAKYRAASSIVWYEFKTRMFLGTPSE